MKSYIESFAKHLLDVAGDIDVAMAFLANVIGGRDPICMASVFDVTCDNLLLVHRIDHGWRVLLIVLDSLCCICLEGQGP